MTDGVAVAIGSVATALIGAMVTISTLIINNRQARQMAKLDRYHAEVNGKISKLLESKDAESLAKQRVAASTGHVTDAPPERLEPLK